MSTLAAQQRKKHAQSYAERCLILSLLQLVNLSNDCVGAVIKGGEKPHMSRFAI